MTFDQNTLRGLLALDDASLWQMIRGIAAQKNVALPDMPMPSADMQRIRSALSSATQNDVSEALRIIAAYQNRR